MCDACGSDLALTPSPSLPAPTPPQAPDAAWEKWFVDGLSLNVHTYSAVSDSTCMRSVRMPKEATVGDLKALVKEQVGRPSVRHVVCVCVCDVCDV